MYLKKLEIYGFKSFADRMEMTFGQGITGVVGPNGCGKSNIGDAVRWVLGEQNARVLRGGRMEDIIFGGTEKRKALAYCEVSLTFDNAKGQLPLAFSEIMVTRRVYRSGESEYFLNKAACRLKDITDLFRDTGIGKEGYSLIGQGRIDEILSVRSEDRRNVFEEAAGISKYKARKEEAERRVEHTEQNLDRVGDILDELESQLEPLAAQAETARRYVALSQELRTLELSDFIHKHDRAKERIAAFDLQREQLEAQVRKTATLEGELRAQIDDVQDAIASMEGEISAGRERELALTREAEAGEGALNLRRQRQEQFTRDRERLAGEDAQAKRALATLIEQDEGVPAQNATHLDEQREKIAALERQAGEDAASLAAREEELEALKAQLIEGMNRMSDVQAAKARLLATREGLAARLEALAGSGADVERLRDEAAAAAQGAAENYEQARAALEDLRAQAGHTRERAEAAAKGRDDAAQLLARTQGALREANSRLKMLEQMERDYEGYNNSVREVMRAARGDAGVLGVVAEVLSVPKEYERAVDMALGGQLQHIVCQTQEDAKRHIDRLRQNRAGRATFLPLDAVRGRTLNREERECLAMPGCLGLASELVSFDERFRPVAENLLGRTVIAQDLTTGIAIMRRARHAFRLVTLEGDVMHSGGSMTGGSVQSRVTSLLSREREIGEYRSAVARLGEREGEAAGRVAELEGQLDGARSELIALQDGAHEREIALEREQSHREHALRLLDERTQARDKFLLEREQIEATLCEIGEELGEMERLAGGEEQTAQGAQAGASRLSGEVAAARAALDELREEISEHKVHLAAAEREHEAAARDRTRREHEREMLTGQMDKRREENEAFEAQAAENLAAMEREQEKLALARDALEAERAANRAQEIRRTARQQALRELLEKREEAQKEQAELTDKGHRAEVAQSRLKADLENLIARIWDAYELSYAGALAYAGEEYDAAQSGSRIEAIRREVRAMGSVNTGAIEDYRQTRERFESLSAQRDDLGRARDDLLGIIADLTRRMEKQFTEQFAVLNANFSQTFRQLFGGGRAELRLADEKNPLTCGIDIVAQPPGKKLQLLSLLSGGERALTAIAILFAMLRAKPTPFCILDEIEAALDENNIANFATFLADYARSTQFIVVTHRKGTMERCDALYGVAMQEKGISSMVSVELSGVERLQNIG